ncbi:uncharacterized protein LOC125236018 [Leguminivora glycinivorella]|uniref:uncharacterized protein LOC125236018 n=1 Tax=Leguminivora glycinivorella TaxID=1035111 RepID=UPI00200D0432|nr:uncharacterized protein LOC125236018 [Leguminivora glycinivorella]
MDEILLIRLRITSEKIGAELETIPSTVRSENIGQAQVVYNRLQAAVNRLNANLSEYFRLATTPASDEIFLISGQQLLAEETLAELKAKIDQVTVSRETQEKPPEVNSSCRLPKLQLQVYNGDVLSWCEFWDSFSSNIDSRNLPDVDKLSYLKTSVTGDAKKAIDGLPTTNGNYKIAVTLLKERFGKKAHLIDAHYATLYKIEAAKSSAEDCRRTFNEVERNLKILESLGENTNHNHLRFMILEKFPSDLIYEIKLKIQNESTQELREQLNKIITAKEDAERIAGRKRSHEVDDSTVGTLHVNAKRAKRMHHFQQGNNTSNTQHYQGSINRKGLNRKGKFQRANEPKKGSKPSVSNVATSANRSATVNPKEKGKILGCIFCNGKHRNYTCQDASTLEERKKRLTGRCFICFRKNHLVKDCKENWTCRLCPGKERHNMALCPSNFPKDPKTKKQS